VTEKNDRNDVKDEIAYGVRPVTGVHPVGGCETVGHRQTGLV